LNVVNKTNNDMRPESKRFAGAYFFGVKKKDWRVRQSFLQISLFPFILLKLLI